MSEIEADTAMRDKALDPVDEKALAEAVRTLEHPSLPGRLSTLMGRQIDLAEQVIPEALLKAANTAAGAALRAAFKAAVATLPAEGRTTAPRFHTALAALSGAAGGAFGLATLPVELPVSTTIILRSIAGIAQQSGEDLRNPEAALACLEVFALGGGANAGPASNSGYWAVRAMLSKSVQQTTRVMLQRGLADESAPALVRFIGQIVSRFGVVVSQKLMAQAIPVIGAITGAALNGAFADHYQSLAKAHFTVRRLERRYGPARVRAAYQRCMADAAGDSAPVRPPTLLAAF